MEIGKSTTISLSLVIGLGSVIFGAGYAGAKILEHEEEIGEIQEALSVPNAVLISELGGIRVQLNDLKLSIRDLSAHLEAHEKGEH